MSKAREWRKHVNQVADQYGCEIVLTGSGHLMLEHPSGWSVLTGSTPGSQWLAMKKLRSQVRNKAKAVGR
jgi:hypothetical protein